MDECRFHFVDKIGRRAGIPAAVKAGTKKKKVCTRAEIGPKVPFERNFSMFVPCKFALSVTDARTGAWTPEGMPAGGQILPQIGGHA
jgi:hypothetical protein